MYVHMNTCIIELVVVVVVVAVVVVVVDVVVFVAVTRVRDGTLRRVVHTAAVKCGPKIFTPKDSSRI